MGVDVKDIQICIWTILKFSMEFSYSCVKKYPFVSGVLLFFFLLYLFLPSVFSFLIYSTPVLVFFAVILKVFFGDEKRNDGISSQKPRLVEGDLIGDKNEKSSVQTQTTRRRNVKEKNEKVYAQSSVEEKDTVFSTACNDALVDKNSLIEENPKDIREVKVDSVTHHVESSSAASQHPKPENCDGSEEKPRKCNGGGSEIEAESSEDDDEGAQEDGNKAVEWTEDDQKNLMDLGISEIERNKRLESLIAKRRARKLLSMQVRRRLMNMGNNDPRGQIASILIPRANPFLPYSSGETQVSPTPGSAPSVLLPMHNPFDLPYEPQEEKPNLTGDSFQQEFMASQQKDMLFCRHESFSLGAFFPGEFKQDHKEAYCYPNFATRQRAPDIPEFSRTKRQSGKEDDDKLIERESFQGESMLHIGSAHTKQGQDSEQILNLVDISHEGDKSAVHINAELVKDANDESSSSSSSEANEPLFNANKDEVIKSIAFEVPKNIAADREDNNQLNEFIFDSRPSVFGRTRIEERFFYPVKEVHHTPTHSIASDLQVEVSEISSPPLTHDGIISPSDGESLKYGMDMDDEKETTPGCDEMWATSSHLSGVEENESRSGEVHEVTEQDIMEVGFSRINQNGPIASYMPQEKVDQQDASNTSSLSSSMTELDEDSQAHSTDIDPEIHNEFQQSRISNSLEILSHENLAARPSLDTDNEKLEEPSYPAEKFTEEVNVIDNMNDLSVSANGGAPIMIEQEAPRDLSVPIKEDFTTSIGIIEENSENLIQDKRIEDREVGQGVEEVGFSGANKNSNDPVALSVLPEVVIEQAPTDPSSSFPDSLLQEQDPSSSPEKCIMNSKIIYNSEVSANTDTEVLKTIKEIDSEACTSIKRENSGDLPKPSEETISEYIVRIEDQPEKQCEHQVLESSADSQSFSDPIALAVLPELAVEQVPVVSSEHQESEFSADSQSFSDPIALAVLPELVVEQVSVVSSSSPKSVLQKEFLMDQASSLNFDQATRIEDQQSLTEMVGNNSSHELPLENFTLTAPQNELHLMEDSTAHQSVNGNFEHFQEHVVNENKGKDSSKFIEGESQTFSSREATTDLLKAVEENFRSNKDNEGLSGELAEYEATISPSKVAEQCDISNNLANKEGELSKPSGNSTEGANINYNANELVIIEKEEALNPNCIGDGESEPQLFVKQETDDSMKRSDGTSSKSIDTEAELKKLTEDEAFVGQSIPMEENENSEIIKDIEEFEKSMEPKDVIHSPKPTDSNENLEATEVVEGESKNLTTYEGIVDTSKPAHDSNIPITFAEIEEPSNPPPGWPIEEANIIPNVNESAVRELVDKVNLEYVVGEQKANPQD